MRNNDSSAKQKARTHRQAMSPAEVLFWSRVRRKALGVQVRRQVPVGIYFLDFYIPLAKLCVEIDGITHEERGESDFRRDEYMRALGIETIRFTASELSTDTQRVVDLVYEAVQARITQ